MRRSAKVCVCDINAKALDTAAQELSGLKTIVCDVSKRGEIEHMVAAAVEALGGLDVLVNNAGIAGPTAPVEEADPATHTAAKDSWPHENEKPVFAALGNSPQYFDPPMLRGGQI